MLGQLTGISYNGTLRHEYRYSATQNDGRITSYKNWQSGEDVEYQYDSLGRLAQAQTVGPQWGQAFSYDGFGNLVAKSVTKGSAPVLNVTASATTNRLNVSGMTYDANGNVTAMPGVGAMTYDGRNRYNGSVAWSTPPDRGYDPSNRRIWRKVGDEIEVDFFLPGGEKLGTYATFLHNGHGQDGSNGAEGCWKATNDPGQMYCIGFAAVKTYYYFGGRLVKLQVGVWPTWYQADRLGSHGQHHPYGEQRSGTTWQDPGFATYWRESSGLDYAVNRHYSSTFGRFTSPDPYRASGGPADPGSWNRYGYVGGDPVNFVDPEGLVTCRVDNGQVKCFDSITVTDDYQYVIVHGQNGWNWSSSSKQYLGYQNIYEQPGCMDPTTGLPCYEADILRLECQDFAGPQKPWNVDVKANIAMVHNQIAELWKESNGDAGAFFGGLTGWFTTMVKPGGTWDFKTEYRGQGDFESFGNWHYGVVGAAAFNSQTFIQFGAGMAQGMTDFINWINDKPRIGEGFPGLPPTFGDQLSDQDYIKRGFHFQTRGCSKLL